MFLFLLFFLKLSQNFRKIQEEMKLLVEKNFSRVQKALRIFADVFGFWLTAKEISLRLGALTEEAKRALLEGKSLSSLGLLVQHLGLATNKIKLPLSPTPSTRFSLFILAPTPPAAPLTPVSAAREGSQGAH